MKDLKVLNCVLHPIVGFCAVDTCAKLPFLAKYLF